LGLDLDQDEQEGHVMSSLPAEFPAERLPAVAEEIAELFGELGFARPGQALLIGAPMAVWVAALIDGDGPPLPLKDAARWTGRFHHQVAEVDGPPIGYARTGVVSGEVIVCEFSDASDLAVAIERGLSLLRECFPEDRSVHLLSIPELQIEALWLPSPPAGSEVVVVRAPEESFVEPFHPLSEEEAVNVLMKHGSLAGMLVGMEEIWFDRTLAKTIADEFVEDALPRVPQAAHAVEQRLS
jgi:hypothetical protein